MENSRIAAVFDEIADILEIQGENPFRIRSYRNAARTVGDLPEHISDLVAAGKDPKDIPGIGESLAEKIKEILATGTCKALVDLRKQLPPHLPDLLKVKGLGPKKVKALWEKRKITTLEQLKAAATAGKLRDLEGMGEKTEQNILKGLATLEAEAGRIGIKQAAEQVASIRRHLEKIKAIRRFEPAGSFRRRRETIGDLDFLIEAADRKKAAEEILKYESVEDVIARGEEKVSVQLASGVQVDFRFVEAGEFGAAWMYFTGSKAHNIALRKRAQKDDLKLSEYGLFRGEKQVAGRTEEEVFKALGCEWIPPEMREDRGEIDAAAEGKLPKLIERGDLRGDLHAHTTATDGNNTIEEMVVAARSHGYEYLAITDHSKAVTVAHGLNDAALRKHADRVREYGKKLKGFWLLAGIEVDILKDGRLDLDEKVLGELDWVCASVHSYFEMPEAEMTERLVRAVRSGVVHCIGHPFGRLIGKRDALHFDPEKVFAACKEMGVCLEINSYPDRLDLPDVHCKHAREMGLTMTISTDSHKTGDLDLIEFGVGVARRGWLEKGDVLNTLTAAALRNRLKGTGAERAPEKKLMPVRAGVLESDYKALVSGAAVLCRSPRMNGPPPEEFLKQLLSLDSLRWRTSGEWANPAITESCDKLIFGRDEKKGGAEEALALFLMCCWINRQQPYRIIWSTRLQALDSWLAAPGVGNPPGLPDDKNHLLKMSTVRQSLKGGIAGWFQDTILQIVTTHGNSRGNVYRLLGRMLLGLLDIRPHATVSQARRLCAGERVFIEYKRAWMALMMLRRDQSLIRRMLRQALCTLPRGQEAFDYWCDESYFSESECQLPVDTRMQAAFDMLFVGPFKGLSGVAKAASEYASSGPVVVSPSAFDVLFFAGDVELGE